MKKVIDIEKAMLAMFMLNSAFKSKFKRYWGTTTIDGVEVFNKHFYYFLDANSRYTMTTAVQKMLKIFGIKKSINDNVGDYQGIQSAWLYLNPDKLTTNITTDLTESLLASRIEDNYTYDKWYNAIITISSVNIMDGVMPIGLDGKRHFDPQQAEDWLLANYQSIVGSSVQSSTELNDADEEFTSDIMAKYVLLDSLAEVYDIVITSVDMVGTPTPTGVFGAVAVSLKFKRIAFLVNESSTYIDKTILALRAASYDAQRTVSNRLFDRDAAVNVGATNDLFYKGYLRVSTMALERSEFSKVVMLALDTGYAKVKKKRKWYQKLLAVVIFIVVVYLTWNPVWGAAAAGATGTALMTAVAYAATISALILAGIAYAASALGYADLVGFYGKFIKLFGIVATVTGIYAAIQNMAQKGIMEALKQRISDMATSVTTFSKDMLMKSMTYVLQATNFVMSNRLSSIQNANNSMQDKISDQEEVLYDMYDKEFNLPLECITWQNSPLKVDDAQFEVDYLYEPTKMNICRPSFA